MGAGAVVEKWNMKRMEGKEKEELERIRKRIWLLLFVFNYLLFLSTEGAGGIMISGFVCPHLFIYAITQVLLDGISSFSIQERLLNNNNKPRDEPTREAFSDTEMEPSPVTMAIKPGKSPAVSGTIQITMPYTIR